MAIIYLPINSFEVEFILLFSLPESITGGNIHLGSINFACRPRCHDVDDSVFLIFINLVEVRAQPISIADMANLRFDISNFNNRPSHFSLERVEDKVP